MEPWLIGCSQRPTDPTTQLRTFRMDLVQPDPSLLLLLLVVLALVDGRLGRLEGRLIRQSSGWQNPDEHAPGNALIYGYTMLPRHFRYNRRSRVLLSGGLFG